MKLWSCCVVLAAAACGGDKATAPIPCDTYHGGIVAVPDSLPGTYDLKSVCSGMKPDQAGASGSVILTGANFTASITSQGSTTNYSGTYATSNPDGITVTLTIPASPRARARGHRGRRGARARPPGRAYDACQRRRRWRGKRGGTVASAHGARTTREHR